jgi:hypothetical protein
MTNISANLTLKFFKFQIQYVGKENSPFSLEMFLQEEKNPISELQLS